MTVSELDLRLSSYELTEWMLYEKITGPLGRKRQDIQTAMICATLVNVNRGKRGTKAKISDFIIPYEKHRSNRQNPQEILRTVKSITKSMGGQIVEGEVVTSGNS
jgi:hypothetical protein